MSNFVDFLLIEDAPSGVVRITEDHYFALFRFLGQIGVVDVVSGDVCVFFVVESTLNDFAFEV